MRTPDLIEVTRRLFQATTPQNAVLLLAAILAACATPPPVNWGREFASPGASLSYEEALRNYQADGMIGITYRLLAKGLPRDKEYHVWMRRLDGASQRIPAVIRLDESGRLRMFGEAGPELEVGLRKMALGEPMQYAVVSDDGTASAFTRIVPFQTAASGDAGCRLGLVLESPKGDEFTLDGSGFAPGEQVEIALSGMLLTSGETVSADASGAFATPVQIPEGVPHAQADASARSTSCTVELHIEATRELEPAGSFDRDRPLPPQSQLDRAVLALAESKGWSLAYKDTDEGLFVWEVPLLPGDRPMCTAVFAWYLKRVENQIALYDPLNSLDLEMCAMSITDFRVAAHRLQQDTKQRWLAEVGPVVFAGPSSATHSFDLLARVMADVTKSKLDEFREE